MEPDHSAATIQLVDYENQPNVMISLDQPTTPAPDDPMFTMSLDGEPVFQVLHDGTTWSTWAREWRPWRRRTEAQRVAREFVRCVQTAMREAMRLSPPIDG